MPADDVRALQQALVDLLRKNGTLTSPEVAEAFLSVPRHLFLPNEPVERAYEDIAIQVRVGLEGRWTSSSSQPSMMAIMLEQLELRPGMRVLEIGAGTGFNAALMSHLVRPGGSVTAVDIQPDLVEDAQAYLREARVEGVHVVAGDGGYGWPEGAPYDRIILTAASPTITPAWRDQLVEGGRLLMPLDLGGSQVSTAFEKRGEELVSISLHSCGFMPLQGHFGHPPIFLDIAQAVDLICTQECGLDEASLLGWLAEPAHVRTVGMPVKEDQIWSGLFTWLAVCLPDRICSLIAADEDLAGIEKPLTALQRPLLAFMQRERNSGVWLLLPSAAGAALLRRAPTPKEGDRAGSIDLEVLSMGDGQAAADEFVKNLQAWEAAGRPLQGQLNIRALAADSDAEPDAGADIQPRPGEHLVSRPWTYFLISYRS